MKLFLRVVAFSLCLVATYSAASFAKAPIGPSAPVPTCAGPRGSHRGISRLSLYSIW